MLRRECTSSQHSKALSRCSRMLTTIVLCGTDSAQLRLNYYLSNAVQRGYDHARVAGKFCILQTVSVRVVALELSLARDIYITLSFTIACIYGRVRHLLSGKRYHVLCMVMSFRSYDAAILHYFQRTDYFQTHSACDALRTCAHPLLFLSRKINDP